MVVVVDVGLWCSGGGGGQRAVGMVVADVGLFDYFFNGFEAGFLRVFWLVYDWIFGVFLVMVVARWCGFCVMVVVVWW